MSTHARIAPSSLARIVACPGSLMICEGVPALPPTEEELEGDAGHWVAHEMAAGRLPAVGSKAPNGVEVDADMIHGGHVWARHTGIGVGITELPVLIPRIHEECWGTPDWRHWDRPLLRLADYKYGFEYVDPFECWQLIGYAAGILDELNMQGIIDDEVRIDFAIVQPRSYHRNGPVQHWRRPDGQLLRGSELRALINIAYMAAAEALKPNARTRTGSHCLHCDGRHACPTLRQGASAAVEFLGKAQPELLHSNAVGVELTILKAVQEMLKARVTGLEEQAEHMLKTAGQMAGWTLENGRARLKWHMPLSDIFALFDGMGVNLRKPEDAITPTQALDRFHVDPAVMDLYASRQPSALKLTPTSNTETRKIFG